MKPTMLSLLGLLTLAGAARADEDHHGPPGPRHKPPQAAFDACKDKKADDACTVTFREHQLTGKCAATQEGPLVCRPERPPGPPPGQQ